MAEEAFVVREMVETDEGIFVTMQSLKTGKSAVSIDPAVSTDSAKGLTHADLMRAIAKVSQTEYSIGFTVEDYHHTMEGIRVIQEASIANNIAVVIGGQETTMFSWRRPEPPNVGMGPPAKRPRRG